MIRDRQADQATLRAVLEAAQSGDHERAGALAEAARADGLEHPLILNVAALRLERQGRMAEALRLLERAVELAPNDIGSRNALGLALLQLGRPAEALEQFDLLIKSNPGLAFAHTSRGNSLMTLGMITEAEASFRRALEIDAKQSLAMAGLAHLASSRGAYAEARAWAEQALALVPGFPGAVMSLAAAELGERRPAEAEMRVRELLRDERITEYERAHASGLLGDILHAEGHWPDAFEAYSACNESLRRMHAARYPDSGGALSYAEALAAYAERADPVVWRSRPAAAPDFSGVRGHVFLMGFPRSGTTLLEVILEGHPDVVSLEEQELLIDSVQAFMRRPQDLDRLLRADAATLDAARSAYWRRVASAKCDVAGKIFVDKYPLNTLKLPLIARLFPDAKILFACRDPRDVVLSCFRHRFAMSAPIYELLSLDGAARYYDVVMRLLVRWTQVLALEPTLVRHEDVVSEFAREMRRVCALLGIEWAPAMGDFALRTRERSVLTPSTAQLVRGLNTEGLGQWHRYRERLAPIEPMLQPWIERFLYDRA